ncbi:ArsR/SmtB family transcription factor [Consotaella aegiceratis]|uniref:ArsR/SmtB family transcription factor n=1 Tax=Consotaella aegiceratis TaxID=3097961 RepID=UPI002F40697C
MPSNPLSFACAVEALKAVAEPTRLRMAMLLSKNDLTVTDLTSILNQSQPRVSRHLRLLTEAGIVDRYREGAWAYFHLTDEGGPGRMIRALLARLEEGDPLIVEDNERLAEVRRQRAARAAAYFAKNAASWDEIRLLHAPDADVEAALLRLLGDRRIGAMLDIGTGTGRLLEVLAPQCERALGVDASREMLAIARAKLDEAQLVNATVRQGDAYHLPVEEGSFDLVTIHQVLHHLDDPASAILEATAALRRGGRLAIVDFAPHDLEFLREEHAHLRLGFPADLVRGYLDAAGLDVTAIETVEPGGHGADQITVTIWLARKTRPLAEVAQRSAELAATL